MIKGIKIEDIVFLIKVCFSALLLVIGALISWKVTRNKFVLANHTVPKIE